MKDLLLGGPVVVKTLNLAIKLCLLPDRLHQRILIKCVPHVQHDYFLSLANQIIVTA